MKNLWTLSPNPADRQISALKGYTAIKGGAIARAADRDSPGGGMSAGCTEGLTVH